MIHTDTTTETLPMPVQSYRRAWPWWMQITILLVVFVAGAVAGAMMTARGIHARMEQYRKQAPLFSEDIVMRLRIRLALSDEQMGKVQEIIERRHPRMIQLRNEGAEQMHTEFDAMVDEIATVLTDVQAERWRDIAGHVRRAYLPPTARAG